MGYLKEEASSTPEALVASNARKLEAPIAATVSRETTFARPRPREDDGDPADHRQMTTVSRAFTLNIVAAVAAVHLP